MKQLLTLLKSLDWLKVHDKGSQGSLPLVGSSGGPQRQRDTPKLHSSDALAGMVVTRRQCEMIKLTGTQAIAPI
jgi:hypothetical protein